jgi:hypothetical protein
MGLMQDIQRLCLEESADWGWETQLFEVCDVLDKSLAPIEKERFLAEMKNRMQDARAEEEDPDDG